MMMVMMITMHDHNHYDDFQGLWRPYWSSCGRPHIWCASQSCSQVIIIRIILFIIIIIIFIILSIITCIIFIHISGSTLLSGLLSSSYHCHHPYHPHNHHNHLHFPLHFHPLSVPSALLLPLWANLTGRRCIFSLSFSRCLSLVSQ